MVLHIAAFETSDGKIFKSLEDATSHERILTLSKDVNNWADKYCYSDMRKEDVVDIILNNADKLLEILTKE